MRAGLQLPTFRHPRCCHRLSMMSSFDSCPISTPKSSVSTARFDHPPYSARQRHTFRTLPIHDANYFGGRLANLREIGPVDGKKRGRLFKRNKDLAQFNVDVWCAQQTLRKRWKQRDWDVVELPFSIAPRELRRVLPELYTDIPQMVDASGNGDCSNVRSRVYPVEDLQNEIFFGGHAQPHSQSSPSLPYRAPLLVDKRAMTLDKFL